MADIKSIADQLVNLTVKDVSELANILKDEYGIEPAAATVGSKIQPKAEYNINKPINPEITLATIFFSLIIRRNSIEFSFV